MGRRVVVVLRFTRRVFQLLFLCQRKRERERERGREGERERGRGRDLLCARVLLSTFQGDAQRISSSSNTGLVTGLMVCVCVCGEPLLIGPADRSGILFWFSVGQKRPKKRILEKNIDGKNEKGQTRAKKKSPFLRSLLKSLRCPLRFLKYKRRHTHDDERDTQLPPS